MMSLQTQPRSPLSALPLPQRLRTARRLLEWATHTYTMPSTPHSTRGVVFDFTNSSLSLKGPNPFADTPTLYSENSRVGRSQSQKEC